MRFDIDRLSKLAGLRSGQPQRLTEASNRSMHDDPALKDEPDHRFGKNQLAEENQLAEAEDDNVSEETDIHFSIFEKAEDDNVAEQTDVVYEVDAKELKTELRRLREYVKSQKEQKLQETSLKRIIEQEVKNVLTDIENGDIDLNITAGWVYGKNKPTNSRKGQIARGIKGIGFK